MMFAELILKTTGRNISSPTDLQVDYREKALPAEEWNEIKGKYFISQKGWDQYAEGITGIRYWNYIWLNDNCGFFDTKEEAKAFCEKNNIKSYHRKGGKNIGYGSVGERSQEVKILKLTENKLNKYFAFNSYIIPSSWRSNGKDFVF